MPRYRITFREVCVYETEIDCDQSREEIFEGEDESWFDAVDQQNPDWFKSPRVDDRELVEVDEIKGPRKRGTKGRRETEAAPQMEQALKNILVMVQQGLDDANIQLIERYCVDTLAKTWGVPRETVGSPDFKEIPPYEHAAS